jgi:hypothetical protein
MFGYVERARERIVVGMIAVVVGVTAYTLLGLAWTFKTAFETSQRLWHSYSRPY